MFVKLKRKDSEKNQIADPLDSVVQEYKEKPKKFLIKFSRCFRNCIYEISSEKKTKTVCANVTKKYKEELRGYK